jgi:ABC-type lipoprotein export system ATPase subunit
MARLDTATLVVDGLDYDYPGGSRALHSVALRARAGELTAIVGASGSGKSTLLACLGALLTPSAGSIRLHDDAVARPHRSAIVTQGAPLFDRLTVWENVATAWGTPRRALRQHALDVLAPFDVAHLADSFPRAISFGQRQRVAIAGCVASDAAVLLADEPTGGLDPENSTRVGIALRTAAASGRIVIAVTHDESIAAIAHRVLRLDRGTISTGAGA